MDSGLLQTKGMMEAIKKFHCRIQESNKVVTGLKAGRCLRVGKQIQSKRENQGP